MQKPGLREEAKCSLGWFQKASSPSQCGHWAELVVAAIRVKGHMHSGSPAPLREGRRRGDAERGCSGISGNPLGGEVRRGVVYVRFPREGDKEEQGEPGFRQVEPTSPPGLSFFHLENGDLFLQPG